jgi:hypothetical protein
MLRLKPIKYKYDIHTKKYKYKDFNNIKMLKFDDICKKYKLNEKNTTQDDVCSIDTIEQDTEPDSSPPEIKYIYDNKVINTSG